MLILHHPKKILSGKIFKHKAYVVSIGERLVQLDYEIQLDIFIFLQHIQYGFFVFHMFDSFRVVKAMLAYALQCS